MIICYRLSWRRDVFIFNRIHFEGGVSFRQLYPHSLEDAGVMELSFN